jgi:hypothetical protein
MTKMNQYRITNYEAHFGWRGSNLIIMTQTQGVGFYGTGITAKTTTSVSFGCSITQIMFAFLTGNYILIHPDIVASGIIYGAEFQSTTPCVGQDPIPAPGSSPCIYSFPYPMPVTGTRRIISVRHIAVYRDDNMAKVFYLDFAVRPVGGINMNVEIQFGKGGSVN